MVTPATHCRVPAAQERCAGILNRTHVHELRFRQAPSASNKAMNFPRSSRSTSPAYPINTEHSLSLASTLQSPVHAHMHLPCPPR